MVSKYTRIRLSGTTDAAGDATVTSSKAYRGNVKAILFNITNLDATADTAITSPGDVVTQALFTLTNSGTDVVVYPKKLAVDNVNGALTATGNIYTEYTIFSTIKAVVAQGGATKAFVIDIYVEEY